jgi:hypothetical protein
MAGDTLTLFDPPAQPIDTSLQAAAKIQGHTARIRQAIYLWLKTQPDATEREISTALSLNPSTTRPRLRELEGNAPWAKGKLPKLIVRTERRRGGMRCYEAV